MISNSTIVTSNNIIHWPQTHFGQPDLDSQIDTENQCIMHGYSGKFYWNQENQGKLMKLGIKLHFCVILDQIVQ